MPLTFLLRSKDLLSRTLVLACVLLFAAPALLWLFGASPDKVRGLYRLLALARPDSDGFRLWQPITYAFVHGSWLHLIFNMLGLWLFAPPLEAERGRLWLAETYFISVLWAGIAHVALSPWLHTSSVLIGASGGLYGLMVAYALHFPEDRIPLLPGLEVRARSLAIFYALFEIYLLLPHVLPGAAWLDGKLGNVAHVAHLGGMLGGLMLGRRPAPIKA
jgi:membrane associated rhomboid family serine protease